MNDNDNDDFDTQHDDGDSPGMAAKKARLRAALQDTTKRRAKKPTPVDTTALKTRMLNNDFSKQMNQDIVDNPLNSEFVQDHERTPGQEQSIARGNVAKLLKTLKAQRDTLGATRAGKLPARP